LKTISSLSLITGIFAGLCAAQGASAADLLYEPRGTTPVYQKVHRTHQVVYRSRAECGDVIISYRWPYEPRTEVVTLCHPPIDWD